MSARDFVQHEWSERGDKSCVHEQMIVHNFNESEKFAIKIDLQFFSFRWLYLHDIRFKLEEKLKFWEKIGGIAIVRVEMEMTE